MSSDDKPILTESQSQIFADFEVKIVFLGQNSSE